MPRSIKFTFPWPPRELNPNAKTKPVYDELTGKPTGRRKAIGWGAKASAAKTYREMCGWLAKTQVQPNQDIHTDPPLTSPVLATTTFYVDSKHRYDLDNLDASLKPLWDGVVDAGILQGDSSEHLRHGESKVVIGKERRVEVTLEEVEG